MEKTIALSQDNPLRSPLANLEPLIKYLEEKSYKRDDADYSNGSVEDLFLTSDLSALHTDLSSIKKFGVTLKDVVNHGFNDTENAMDFYAIAEPLSGNIFCSSEKYQNFFSSFEEINKDELDFLQVNQELAYQFILKNFYGLDLIVDSSSVYTFTHKISGLEKFIEFELIADFTNVSLVNNLPDLEIQNLANLFNEIRYNNLLVDSLPINLFAITGIVIIKAKDVTMKESMSRIKNVLLEMPYFGDLRSFQLLQKEIQNLIELPNVNVCLISAIRDNNYPRDLTVADSSSLLQLPISFIHKESSLWIQLNELFERRSVFIISDFSTSSLRQFPFLKLYADAGIKSVALFPLKYGEELIGIFSITTNETGQIISGHVSKIEMLIPMLVIALTKQSGKMDDEIDRVIKEQFTAVQSSVNWKFTEAARNYIYQKNKDLDSEIESIVFENVFPLYGSIDVRNSSIERSTAIQRDLLEQLQLADGIIRKCKGEIYLFSLQEISYRIDKYLDIASLILFPGDEMAIQSFLDEEITGLFNHLKKAVPSVSSDIDNYFFLLNADTNKISNQCAAFEKSITIINNELVKFINSEQSKVQEIYAHYFEYFVTDGIDFNIYIGQSITPHKPFDQFYLKNLKLWQLTTLVKAARKVRDLRNKIPVALDTTQLILAHSKPLSISFRVAERKFDVDGAYNIHYEIIKKRIDKVKIMGTCERLTQPGKISIVFAHDKEAQEYTSYINYLQKEGLLEETIEYFELEELPGVRGLKALRVSIIMDVKEDHSLLTVVDLGKIANVQQTIFNTQ